jgi:acyl-CoA synthetase (AMP-forming)/AMP-acid ligase II
MNILQIFERHADERRDQIAFTDLKNGEIEDRSITYGELRRQAVQLAATFCRASEPGERVIIALPDGIDFIVVFVACLYARLVPVPVKPPDDEQSSKKLHNIALDCGATALFTAPAVAERYRALQSVDLTVQFKHIFDSDLLRQMRSTAAFGDVAVTDSRYADVAADDLALLQYTSGSTGAPKGVMVTHRNLVENQAMITIGLDTSGETLCVSWLPMFHDMGLMGVVLHTLYLGARSVLMTAISFVQKPSRWIKALSKYRATITGGPNFAYKMLVSARTLRDLDDVDLSSLRTAYCGSEPISPNVVQDFLRLYEKYGLRPETFCPGYGLAEATLLVSSGGKVAPVFREIDAATGRIVAADPSGSVDANPRKLLTGCGKPVAAGNQQVEIVDPLKRRLCVPGETGEIWVSGLHVTRGYWDKPDATASDFGGTLAERPGRRYLRTGDLGVIADGELFIAGRTKEIIIVNGRKYYPQDIEDTSVTSHPAVHGMRAVAFGAAGERSERVVIVQELGRQYLRDLSDILLEQLTRSIKGAVLKQHALPIEELVYVKPHSIARTTSGKLCRVTCRRQYQTGTLETIRR